jgi:hypothetical protein
VEVAEIVPEEGIEVEGRRLDEVLCTQHVRLEGDENLARLNAEFREEGEAVGRREEDGRRDEGARADEVLLAGLELDSDRADVGMTVTVWNAVPDCSGRSNEKEREHDNRQQQAKLHGRTSIAAAG